MYGYSGVGNLAAVLAPAESLGFSYDGSLLTGVTWTGPVSGEVTAEYDNDFRVSGLSVNGNPLAAFSYDADGLLQGAGDLGIYRDPLNGRIDSTFVGTVTTAETYDQFGQWATRTARADTAELYRAEYTRDDLGRITGLLEIIEGDTTVFAYTYDDAGRLEEVETNGSVTATYEYDDNGNRLSVTRPGGTETGTYDDQDRLLTYGSVTYGYTKAGELQFKVEGTDTTFYRYDALGNLLEVNLPDGTDVEYVVDGFNRRVGKKVNGVLVQGWLYQGPLNPVAELDSTGNVVSQFVYGTRANVPEYLIRDDTTYRIVSDYLGSVRLVVNATGGTVVQQISYDEFGRELDNTNPGFQSFGYAGGLTDEDAGFIRFGARDYVPGLGRWSSTDPIGFDGGANLYSYVGADPINRMDPSGLCRIDIGVKKVATLPGLRSRSSLFVTEDITAWHAYVLTTEPDGSQDVFRGGPEGNLFALGAILAEWGPFSRSRDFPGIGEFHRFVNLLADDCPCDSYETQFAATVDAINAARIEYVITGPNSNSVAYTLLREAGFSGAEPPFFLPGWGSHLLSGN